jgi:hypothetical protein
MTGTLARRFGIGQPAARRPGVPVALADFAWREPLQSPLILNRSSNKGSLVSFGDKNTEYPYSPPQEFAPAQLAHPTRQGHSGLGVASFRLGILAGLGCITVMAVAGILGSSGAINGEPAAAMIVGLSMIVVVMTTAFAAGLAVGGLVQKEKSRVFPIIGLIINSLLILSLFGLVLVGMTFAQPGGGF